MGRAVSENDKQWCPNKNDVVPKTGDPPERKSEASAYNTNVVPKKRLVPKNGAQKLYEECIERKHQKHVVPKK